MHKLPFILDTGAGPNFHCEGQLPRLLKSQITPVITVERIHNTNHKPLHIEVCLKLYVHVDQLMELRSFMGWLMRLLIVIVCERLTLPAILGCHFCDQMVQCIYPRIGFVNLIDGSTVSIIHPYKEQRPANTLTSKNVKYLKQTGRVSPEIRPTQCVHIWGLAKKW